MEETSPSETTNIAEPGWIEALLALDSSAASDLGIAALILLTAIFVVYLLTARVAIPAITAFAEKSAVKWDDILIKQRVFHRLIPVAPLIVLQWGVRWVPGLPEVVADLVATLALCFIILFVVRSFAALMETANEIYRRYSSSAERPIKGYIQVVQVISYIVAGLLVVSLLIGRSPMFLLSGLGAMTAVLLLVFRDSLLSFVAGIQLTQNDLIRVGDWIEMPQFNADGDVVEVALNVVTVQNWDRTITVIPTHKFLDHSFRNWRGMADAGGRRIMRNINLDLSTVRFLKDDEIERLRSIVLLREYIDKKLNEISEHNKEKVPSEFVDNVVNQRKLTNVGTFRAYITAYLRQHPGVHQEMTFLVRQLAPTSQGLPIQIYVFSNDIQWANYEAIQGNIFDHLLSIVPEFGLRMFQEPSGTDISRLTALSEHTESRGNSIAEGASKTKSKSGDVVEETPV